MVFGLSSPQNCTTSGAAGWVCFTFFFVRVELFASFFHSFYFFCSVFNQIFVFGGPCQRGTAADYQLVIFVCRLLAIWYKRR